MKVKKLLVLVVLLSLWGGTMMFADSVSQKVRVIVNGSELKETGVLTDGNTYLPLRQIADTLQSLITWDEASKKVTLNKPNVHMFTFNDKANPFGGVTKGSAITFSVWAQVDSLYTNISAIKVSIVDPYGREDAIQTQEIAEKKDNFWFKTKEIKYNFDVAGNYAIRMYMKPSDSNSWSIVSEKLIISEARK